jgi:hypothetical protein
MSVRDHNYVRIAPSETRICSARGLYQPFYFIRGQNTHAFEGSIRYRTGADFKLFNAKMIAEPTGNCRH